MSEPGAVAFWKMHGAGNHFVVLDALDQAFGLDLAQIRRLGDARRGVGFDQLLVVERDARSSSGLGYRIYNTDGSVAAQCGNGARCVVSWLVRHRGLELPASLMSPSGPVHARFSSTGEFEVGLGQPVFDWSALPLLRGAAFAQAAAAQGCCLEVLGQHVNGWPLSMGNPHLVIPVNDVETADVQRIGAALNRHPALPDGVNASFVQVLDRDLLGLRVYERGVGETLACGSAACASAVVAIRQGWVRSRHVRLQLPGGELTVYWGPDDRAEVRLSGPVRHVYDGLLVPGWDA